MIPSSPAPHDLPGVPRAPLRPRWRAELLLCLLCLLLAACAPRTPRFPGPLAVVGQPAPAPPEAPPDAPPSTPVTPEPPPSSGPGQAVADAAQHYLKRAPKGFRDDCSGFVCAIYTRAGMPLAGNTASMWETARSVGATHTRKRPEPGDLAFFDNTYDRNRNGRPDDPLTHVAVVLSVAADGTIEMAHAGTSRGRSLLYMNLYRPEVHSEDGRILNSFLRHRTSRDRRGIRYLSGELWRGFARPEAYAEDASASTSSR